MQRPVKEVIADLDLARATDRISPEEHANMVAKVRASEVDGVVDFDSSRFDAPVRAGKYPGRAGSEMSGLRVLNEIVPGRIVSLLLKGVAVLVGAMGGFYLIVQALEVSDTTTYASDLGYAGVASAAITLILTVLACLAAAAIIDLLRFAALTRAGALGGALSD